LKVLLNRGLSFWEMALLELRLLGVEAALPRALAVDRVPLSTLLNGLASAA